MSCDILLPDLVWYLGTPFEGARATFSARRTDDGRTYTFVWRQESLARQFAAKSCFTEVAAHCAQVEMVVTTLIYSGIEWVLIDPPEDTEAALDNPSFQKLDCKRTGDVWPYFITFLCTHDVPQGCVGPLTTFAKANPELPPLEMLASFTSLWGEHTEALNDLVASCRTYAAAMDKDPDQVIGAVLTTGFPSQPCSRCGEKLWRFGELSPNAVSSSWTCLYCGKRLVLMAHSAQNQEGSLTRQPIPKAVQREVWQRDQGRCVECGSRENLEFDHIIPVSRGGATTTRNVQLLCESCNRRKSDREPGA
jgi:hypothetical protein